MSCANNVLPVYMWPSPGKIPEALCLPPVQVDTVHFSSEATETNGFSRLSSSLNRTAVSYTNSCLLYQCSGPVYWDDHLSRNVLRKSLALALVPRRCLPF